MGAALLSPLRRQVWRRAAVVAVLAACVDGPGGPGQFGELRVEPGYRAGYEPAAIGATLDTAAVVVVRRSTNERVLDTRVPYSGGALAWVLDLRADEDSLDVAVELRSGGQRLYAGDTNVVVFDGTVASDTSAIIAVEYVGPAIVASITVQPADSTLNTAGATLQFVGEAVDLDGNVIVGQAFQWSSSDTSVGTVDPVTGLATAVGSGTATITAAAGGKSGSATLGVSLPAPVASVVVTPATATLSSVGATQQFAAEALDSSGNVVPGVAFTWTSSVGTVATIDSMGVATATGHGTTTITATTGSVSGTATLTVNLGATVDSVVLTPAAATLGQIGATQQFTAAALDASGDTVPGVSFTWTSATGAVASIDSTGLATATGHGTTTITATTGSVSGTATLTVNLVATVDTVIVSPAAATLTALGVTQQFTAVALDASGDTVPGVSFTWTSATGTVASIDSTGLATATGHGSSTITATTGSVSGAATLTVNLAATVDTVIVTPATATVSSVGTTQLFMAEALDSSGSVVPGVAFTWTSSLGTVATIDSSGLATATGHGTTTITATTGSVSGTATLTVNLAATVDTVIVTPAAATLGQLGATQQFTAEALDSSGNVVPGVSFTWTSSVGTVATIDSVGLATATGHGSTTITATTGSVSGTATLTVNLAATVDTVIVTPAGATLGQLGATQQFTAEALDSSGNVVPGVAFTWTSSTGTVATIDSTGLTTATGHGSSTITATTGSVSGTATLTVNLAATVDTVIVTPAAATLGQLGATQQFTAVALDSSGDTVPGVSFTWTSATGTVASIDSTGLATAKGHGSSAIAATTGSVSGSAILTVNLAATVDTVIVTPDTATLSTVGATQQFTAVAQDSGGNTVPGVTFTWTSSLGTVATIDSTGLATTTGHGTTTITATTGLVSGTASLTVNLVATVDTVIVTPATATLSSRGAAQQFTAEARDSNGTVVPGITFAWTSSNGTVATVDTLTGLATAAQHGSAVITATTGTKSGSAALTVDLAATVDTVIVTPATTTLLARGTTQQFSAEALDSSGNVVPGVAFTWTSSLGTVATIDSTGLATATGHGTTTITATTGSVSGTASLAVNLIATVDTVIVTPAAAALGQLESTQQFSAEARDSSGNVVPGVAFTWTSSLGTVATIDSTGLATATGHGATTITATTGSVSGTATLVVDLEATVDTVIVSPAAAALTTRGATQHFTAEALDSSGNVLPGVSFTWISSRGAVATIDSTGLATATGHGTTTITATTGSVSGSATLTVNLEATVDTILVSPSTFTLSSLGATQAFTAEARDSGGNVVPGVTFAWSSLDQAVITADTGGLVTAIGNGVTSVVAATGGKTGTAAVTVSQDVVSVTVTPGSVTLAALGATQPFSAAAFDANGHPVAGAAFVWSSADAAVATVDSATGLATAVAEGTTTVTAVVGAASATATVGVDQVVTTVVVTPAAATLTALGATQAFTAEGRDANGHVVVDAVFTWRSDDAATAAIDTASGLATAVGNGTTTITADAGSAAGSATLTVAQEVVSLSIQPGAVTLTALGATAQLVAEGRDANGNLVTGAVITWSSATPGVATVDPATGLVTAAANGNAAITAASGTATASITVTVGQVVTTVVVTPDSAVVVGIEKVQQFAAAALDANGHAVAGVVFAWTSDNPAVATVNSSGRALSRSRGVAHISATASGVAGVAVLIVQ